MALNHDWRALGALDSSDPVEVLATFVGPSASQVIESGASVGVDHEYAGVFFLQMGNDRQQNGVLKDVGMIACMKTVTIAKQ